MEVEINDLTEEYNACALLPRNKDGKCEGYYYLTGMLAGELSVLCEVCQELAKNWGPRSAKC